MTEDITSLSSLKQRSWSDWVQGIDRSWKTILNDEHEKKDEYRSVRVLFREDICLYGIYPKVEPCVFIECEACKKLLHPRVLVKHSHRCSKSVEQYSKTQLATLRKKSGNSKNKKKTSMPPPIPPPPLFSATEMAENTSSLASMKQRSWSDWIQRVDRTWKTILIEEHEQKEEYRSVRVLFREDIHLYGIYPKVEPRVFIECEACKKLIYPRALLRHSHRCNEVSAVAEQHSKTNLVSLKKKSGNTKNKKKISLPPPVPPPPLFSESPTVPFPPISISTDLPPSQSKEITSSSASHQSSTSSSSSSSGHKKSRKSNKVTKEFDPDKHCGVVDGTKGPCLRALTCTNHQVKINLRKVVPGRSKDLHQLLVKHKFNRERGGKSIHIGKHNSESNDVKTTSIGLKNSTKIFAKVTQCLAETTTTANSLIKPITTNTVLPNIDNGYVSSQSSEEEVSSSQETKNKISVVYMPMSPVSVVSPIQLKLLHLGTPAVCISSPQTAPSPPLPTQSTFLTIPNHGNVSYYKSHPKPLVMSTVGIRKIGGSFVLHNQRIEHQRKDIQVAINTKRVTSTSQSYKPISLLNNMHKPNILKFRNVGKMSTKRPPTDKINSGTECKQIRLSPEVNGFIIHADVSEAAEAPQPNNNIQEKKLLY